MKSKISAAYIAGFFDGEGSAMVLTHRVKEKIGYHYRIRPVIKIVQKTKSILVEIKKYLGYKKMISFQIKKNQPYERELFEKIIDIRDKIFALNKITRTGIKQFHLKDKILKEHVFINIEEFELLRRLKGNAKNKN